MPSVDCLPSGARLARGVRGSGPLSHHKGDLLDFHKSDEKFFDVEGTPSAHCNINRKCFKPFTKVNHNNDNSQNIVSFCGIFVPALRPGLCPWTFPLDPTVVFRPPDTYTGPPQQPKPAYVTSRSSVRPSHAYCVPLTHGCKVAESGRTCFALATAVLRQGDMDSFRDMDCTV